MAKYQIGPVPRQSLSERLAEGIRRMIHQGAYREGDRLPPITEMARSFGVGHPTAREALKKLEALGVVEIRHGSGVYVSRSHDLLVLPSPHYMGPVTPKLLQDVVRARMPLELQAVADAAVGASREDLVEMRRRLTAPGERRDPDGAPDTVNTDFHRAIAVASGNTVLVQLLDVLQALFADEQLRILAKFGSRQRDYQEHLAILDALDRRDATRAVERMRQHLEGVLDAIARWDTARLPVD